MNITTTENYFNFNDFEGYGIITELHLFVNVPIYVLIYVYQCLLDLREERNNLI